MQVRPLLTQPIALAVYEYENGQIGHMRTPMGELQLLLLFLNISIIVLFCLAHEFLKH